MVIPTGNRILVKPDPVETQTKSGIVLAIDAKREGAASVTGVVIAVGELAWKEFVDGVWKMVYEPYAKIGDRIQYRRYTGVIVEGETPDTTYLLMNDSDVLGRVERETENV